MRIIKVTSNKREATMVARRFNKDFSERDVKRVAYVKPVSQKYVKSLTREGYPVRKNNYAVAIKNKKGTMTKPRVKRCVVRRPVNRGLFGFRF